MAGEKDSFSLDESQTIKTSFKINKVPTNADALVLANQGAFGAGEFVITPQDADDRDFFLLTHPIGSYYITEESTSPVDKYGGGWTQIKDRFLLAAGGSYTLNATGGSADAIVVSHTHTMQSAGAHTHTAQSAGGHSHSFVARTSKSSISNDWGTNGTNIVTNDGSGGSKSSLINTGGAHTHSTDSQGSHTHTIDSKGSSGTGKNMPPYLAVYIWKRIS